MKRSVPEAVKAGKVGEEAAWQAADRVLAEVQRAQAPQLVHAVGDAAQLVVVQRQVLDR